MSQEYSISLSMHDVVLLHLDVKAKRFSGYKGKVNVMVGHRVELERKSQRIVVRLLLRVMGDDTSEEAEDFGRLELSLRYNADGVDRLPHSEGGIEVPKPIAATLIYDGYATARGIWFAKVMGTPLQKVAFPFMLPDEFLKRL